MQSIESFVAANYEGVLAADEERLFQELGAAAAATERNPSSGAEFALHGSDAEFGLVDLAGLGRRLFKRSLGSLKSIICGDSAEDAADRKKILDALKLGDRQTVITALAGAVIGVLGLTGPIAVLIATIIVGRLIGAAIDFAVADLRPAVCEALTIDA